MNPRPSAVRRASAGTAVPSRTGRRRRASRRRSRARATRSCTCGLVGPGFATSFKRMARAFQRRKSDRKQAFQRRENDRKRRSPRRAAAKRVDAHRHQEERRADAHRDRGENRHRRRERHDRGRLDGERSAQAHLGANRIFADAFETHGLRGGSAATPRGATWIFRGQPNGRGATAFDKREEEREPEGERNSAERECVPARRFTATRAKDASPNPSASGVATAASRRNTRFQSRPARISPVARPRITRADVWFPALPAVPARRVHRCQNALRFAEMERFRRRRGAREHREEERECEMPL